MRSSARNRRFASFSRAGSRLAVARLTRRSALDSVKPPPRVACCGARSAAGGETVNLAVPDGQRVLNVAEVPSTFTLNRAGGSPDR
jgi:DNA-binding IclR family transcriptional regulator